MKRNWGQSDPHRPLIKCLKLRTPLRENPLRERPHTSTYNMNPFFCRDSRFYFVHSIQKQYKEQFFIKNLIISDNINSNNNTYILLNVYHHCAKHMR